METLFEPSSPFLRTLAALSLAFLLGTVIGVERQIRQRTAGLRTNVLVSVGAAAFVDLGVRIAGADGAARIASYVVSGIGFLGAGVIMKEGAQVRGLNTAATLWASAAVGAFAGAAQWGEAALVAMFVLAGNTLLRPVVQWIDRRPLRPEETEALYRVHVTVKPEAVAFARDLLAEEVEAHGYPLRDITVETEAGGMIELAAELAPASADTAVLDRIADHLARHPGIAGATWTVSATG